LVQGLENEFEMKVTNEPRTYLGMEISQNDTSIFISQIKYAQQVLSRYNMSECKSVSIPIAENGEPEKVNPKNAEPKFPYRESS